MFTSDDNTHEDMDKMFDLIPREIKALIFSHVVDVKANGDKNTQNASVLIVEAFVALYKLRETGEAQNKQIESLKLVCEVFATEKMAADNGH